VGIGVGAGDGFELGVGLGKGIGSSVGCGVGADVGSIVGGGVGELNKDRLEKVLDSNPWSLIGIIASI